MILDKSYFLKYPVFIPQADGYTSPVATAVKNNDILFIESMISVHEPRYYKFLLGNDLANEFIEAYKASIAETSTPLPSQWTTFISKAFDTTNKTSPCANFVYYYACYELEQRTTRVGTKVSKIDGGDVISPDSKAIISWNLGVERNIELLNWLAENKSDYEHDSIYFNPYLVRNEPELCILKNIYGI